VEAAWKRLGCSRTFGAFSRWAVARGDVDADPVAVRRQSIPEPRERVLVEAEIATLWASLPSALSPVVQRIVKLCLLTGQRVGEVAGIVPGEIDATQRIWTIPAARSKNAQAHSVPLTDASLILAEQIASSEKLTARAVAKTIRRAEARFGIPHFTAHDLRRTVVTQLAELGVSPIVLGHVANHRSITKAGVTLKVYSKYAYEKEKREALELWADRLAAIVGGGGAKVLPLGRKARG
jgi:integrase